MLYTPIHTSIMPLTEAVLIGYKLLVYLEAMITGGNILTI